METAIPLSIKIINQMRIFSLTIFLVGAFNFGFCQIVVKNTLIPEIDFDFNEVSKVLSHANYSEVKCYRCAHCNRDSCKLVWQKNYDVNGRIIQFIKGPDLNRNKIDFICAYKRFNDSLFETNVRYPPGSTAIPWNFYIDTVINNIPTRLGLYKHDQKNALYVRSLYFLNDNGDIDTIRRYDIDNKLVHLYLPLGEPEIAKKEWQVVNLNTNDSVISRYETYETSTFSTCWRFSRSGLIKEKTFAHGGLSGLDSIDQKQSFFYDSKNELVAKLTTDLSNHITVEERYYYNHGKLARYTKDDWLEDTLVKEEKIYDENSNLILYRDYNRFNSQIFTWKYKYSKLNLLTKLEFYINGGIEYCEQYKYQ
jgi:hypothetical protein